MNLHILLINPLSDPRFVFREPLQPGSFSLMHLQQQSTRTRHPNGRYGQRREEFGGSKISGSIVSSPELPREVQVRIVHLKADTHRLYRGKLGLDCQQQLLVQRERSVRADLPKGGEAKVDPGERTQFQGENQVMGRCSPRLFAHQECLSKCTWMV